ncbi:MAG: DUF945 family protein [Pseudomonadota bacterium]
MSKFLKIALALALIVFIVAPGVTGFLVESAIEKEESAYTQMIEQGPFKLADSSFERGWFSSDQTVELDLTDPAVAAGLHLIGGADHDGLPKLVIETKATHGVIPLASPAKGGLRPAIAQTESALSLKYGNGEMIELPVTVYSSLGAGQWARIVADPIDNFKLEDEATVSWDGADISATIGDKSTFSGSLGSVQLASAEGTMNTSEMTIEGTHDIRRFKLGEGETNIKLDNMRFSAAQAGSFELNDLAVKSSMAVDDGRAIAQSDFLIGDIQTSVMNIDGIDMSAIYNVNAAALEKFIELTQELQSSALADESELEDPAAMMAAMQDLLAEGVGFTLERFNVEMGGDTLKMDLDMQLPPGTTSLPAVMANGQASGNMVIPEGVVSAISELSPDVANGFMMASMMGFVEEKDGAFEARMSYKDGVLLLNDLPVPLPF